MRASKTDANQDAPHFAYLGTPYCGSCGMAMPRTGQMVSCPNPICSHYGIEYLRPTVELKRP